MHSAHLQNVIHLHLSFLNIQQNTMVNANPKLSKEEKSKPKQEHCHKFQASLKLCIEILSQPTKDSKEENSGKLL